MKTKKSTGSSSLSSRALLVNVNIKQWIGRRTDKKATDTVIKAHKTSEEAGKYTKKLLPGAAELQEVSAQAMCIRKYFYEQTLPWVADGSRIISAKNHLKFAAEIRKMVGEFERCTKAFESAYPKLQSKAQAQLGSLYSAADYPTHAEIKGKFKCDVRYFPVPDVDDFRVKLSEGEKKEFVEKMKETEAEAMRSVWERLHNVVQAAAKKLGSSDAIFRDSLLENITDLCDMLPALNVSEDPKLDQAREDLKKILSGYSADGLRADKKQRSMASKKLKEMTDKMDSFMGGSK